MELSAERVAARYQRASTDVVLDRWVDLFLTEFGQGTKITEKSVERLLQTQGISADDLELLDGNKQAGERLRALGGWVRRGLWYLLVRPFLLINKLVRSSAFRNEVKAAFHRELNREARSTRHLINVAGRLARGEAVSPHERKAALKQLGSLMSKAILITLISSSGGPLSSGVWAPLRALMGPLEEIYLILLNRPLQATVKKLLTVPI